MTHDVNPSGKDVAAQVRSALISKISSERLDLWMPESTEWIYEDGVLTLRFEQELMSQFSKQFCGKDVATCLREVVGSDAELAFEVAPSPVSIQPASPVTDCEDAADSSDSSAIEKATQLLFRSEPNAISKQESCVGVGHEVRTLHSASATVPKLLSTAPMVSSLRSPRDAVPRDAVHAVATKPVRPAVDRGNEAIKASPPPRQLQAGQFVTGPCNELAWSAAQLVVSHPDRCALAFLHGPSGSGKSMLASAIAHHLRHVGRLPRVVHMSSEQFLNEFTEGLRKGGLPLFRRKYRDAEALILEDIQFFVGKKSSISEVKHTLDHLQQRGKRVFFTADRSLNELKPLGGDLVARIQGGVSTPVLPLDRQTRAEILKREFVRAQIKVDERVAAEIAERIVGDGRLLNGIVNRLRAVSMLDPDGLDWQRCWSAITDLVQATQSVVRLVDIDYAVCDVLGLDMNSLQSSSKMRRMSQPRMLAMFLWRKYTPSAYNEIGNYFGKRRHSTVISAEKTVKSWLQENAEMDLGRGLTVCDALRQVESRLQVG